MENVFVETIDVCVALVIDTPSIDNKDCGVAVDDLPYKNDNKSFQACFVNAIASEFVIPGGLGAILSKIGVLGPIALPT